MEKKILLLNSNFEFLQFVSERKAIKFLVRDKVDCLGYWDDEINYANGSFKLPSVLRLKNQAYRNFYNASFTRYAVFKRDHFFCQYCKVQIPPSQATLDHVVPQTQDGKNSFTNCVTACFKCNNNKGGRTPEQAGMKLIRIPEVPNFRNISKVVLKEEPWNLEWNNFLPS